MKDSLLTSECADLWPFLTPEERAEIDKLLATYSPEKEAAQLSFREFVSLVNPPYKWYRHCEELADVLQRVADGEIKRLMVFMPPRHGKSESVSRLFAAYYMRRFPSRWAAIASYAAELAYTLSRNAREFYQRSGGLCWYGAAGVEHWETALVQDGKKPKAAGGGLWAAGVGGPATGKGFHLGIVDDPLKNAEEAESFRIREKQKDWWRSTWYTRQEPDAALIVIQTRWNEDDLAGWLLKQEQSDGEEPENWYILNMPAVAEPPTTFPATCTVHPDYRATGEALCPERWPAKKLAKIARKLGAYFWSALFQQSPRHREGNTFKYAWIKGPNDERIVDAWPRSPRIRRVRYWDRAGSERKKADQSAGTCQSFEAPDGLFTIEDVVYGRWAPTDRDEHIVRVAREDRAKYGKDNEPWIWIERQIGVGGKEADEALGKKLAGYRFTFDPPVTNKEARAQPFASQLQAGNVRWVRASWNDVVWDQMTAFPHGDHDDIVDSLSGSHNKLIDTFVPSFD